MQFFNFVFHDFFAGWLDDALFISRDIDKRDREMAGKRNVIWNNFSSHHAFTTGRQRSEAGFGGKGRPKGPSQTLKVSLIFLSRSVLDSYLVPGFISLFISGDILV